MSQIVDRIGCAKAVCLVIGFVQIGGCGCPGVSPAPDVAAVTVVVKDVYGLEGQGRMIFLDDDPNHNGLDQALLADVMQELRTDLGVHVSSESEADRTDPNLPALTPVDSHTHEVGIAVFLGRFEADVQGNLRVEAGYARSGRDQKVFQYVLARRLGQWTVIEKTLIAIS
jgi:hypothetical protein